MAMAPAAPSAAARGRPVAAAPLGRLLLAAAAAEEEPEAAPVETDEPALEPALAMLEATEAAELAAEPVAEGRLAVPSALEARARPEESAETSACRALLEGEAEAAAAACE